MVIRIEFLIDWCIRQAQQWVRWHRINEKRRQQSDKRTHLSTKNRIATRVAGSTPIPRHCRNWHQVPHRLMYQKGATVGEMTSNERKETTTEWQNVLTSPQEIELRLASPDLRLSQSIPAIGIECRIDWCIIQAQQWVRWHRMNEKLRRHRRQQHLPLHKKSNCDTSRRIYACPKLLPQLALNSASIDV